MKKIYSLLLIILVIACCNTYAVCFANSVVYVPDANAKVKVEKNKSVDIYNNENKEEIVYTLKQTTKVYIKAKGQNISFVQFVDGNRELVEGYIENSHIKGLGLSSGEIVAIVLASISAATLVGLATFFAIYYKKKNKE